MIKKIFLAAALLALLALPAAAAGEAELARTTYRNPAAGMGLYPGTPAPGSITVECDTMSVMNTIKMTYATEIAVARHCFDALVAFDASNRIVPAAAERWEATDDGMRWTFHLRPGAKWVDASGAEIANVTAHDFVLAWRELLEPANAAEYWSFASIFKNARAYYEHKSGAQGARETSWGDVGIRAIDDLTLELELETYIPDPLQYVKFEVLSPVCSPLYERVGADAYGTSPETMAYNGPFRMTSWTPESEIVVAKNASWRDAANVELEEIRFVKYTNSNTKMNAFQGGEIDLIDITGEQRAMFAAEGYPTSPHVGGYSFFFYCNTLADAPNDAHPSAKRSDLRSLALRRAISAALDRSLIIKTVHKNDNVPPKCFTLGISGVSASTFDEAVVAANGGEPLYPAAADGEQAKKYLAEALTELGRADASEIDVTIMTGEGTQSELFSQIVQETLRRTLGIEAKIEVLTITECRARRNAINYDLFAGGWGPDYNDPMSDLEIWTSTNGNNHSGWSNAEYDALIESARTERDPAARERLFIEAEKMLARDLPMIPLYWRSEDSAASEKITAGAVRCPFQHYTLTYVELAKP